MFLPGGGGGGGGGGGQRWGKLKSQFMSRQSGVEEAQKNLELAAPYLLPMPLAGTVLSSFL